MVQAEPPSFAALLRRYRRAAGMTQETLADQAGISARTVSDLERGLYLAPRRDTVALLSRALALTAVETARLEEAINRRRGPRPDGQPEGETEAPPPLADASPDAGASGAAALPAALTPLIGREAEVRAISRLVGDPEVRLLTLGGPAGVGKTRLALHVAGALAPSFADGVAFVALDAVADPDLVLPAVARATGVTTTPGRALDVVLADGLRPLRLLLVLDNFEQVVGAAAHIVALLSACPDLTALVTSRAPLRVRGERLFPVPALDEAAAVRLFRERALATAPDLDLADGAAAAIVAICRRLDGLPLAIELAAARTRLLSPDEVLERLSRPLALLTAGPRDLPERHQALRAAIAWSYDLLSLRQQAVFRRLAVFAGGCTLEAAATVCAAAGGLEVDPLDSLEALVDHSLVRREPAGRGGGARLRLLETLREFALERLAAAGEQPAAEQAHARFYLDLAERGARELIGPTLELWLDRLEADHDNLRRALRRAIDGDGAEMALRMGAALSRFWSVRGHFREGWRWLEAALALPGTTGVPGTVRARALNAAGILAQAGNEYRRADALFEDSLVAARATGDTQLIAEALNSAGSVARARGDIDRAVTLFEEALAMPGISAYPRNVAQTMFNLAMVARDRQDFDRAESLLGQCRELQGVLGDRHDVAVTLNIQGSIAAARGDYARAAALHQEGVAIQQVIGHKRGLAVSYSFMCAEAAAAGDGAGAAHVCRQALLACRELGERWNAAECLTALARLAWSEGRADGAARLLGAAGRLRAGGRASQQQRLAETRLLEGLREGLGQSTFDASWAAGDALSFEGAVELGLAATRDLE